MLAAIKSEPFDEKKAYGRLPCADAEGGVNLNAQSDVVSIIMDVVKKLGKKLGEGNFDLMTIPKPMKICSTRSFLENLGNDFMFCTPYLNAAAECKDPVKRLQLIIPFMLGGLSLSVARNQTKTPFEPLLGETYTARKPDGTELYCEFFMSNLPTMLFSIYGPNGLYKAHGWAQLKVDLGVNSLEGNRPGKTTIYFQDGSEIQTTCPALTVNNLLLGRRHMDLIKKPFLVDRKNGYLGEIFFKSDNKDTIVEAGKRSSKSFLTTIDKKPSDYLGVVISKYQKLPSGELKKDPVALGSGSWLEYIQFENEVIWRVNDSFDEWIVNEEDQVLPSHSCLRPDRNLAVAGDIDKAGIEKDKLTNQEEYDQKLRKAQKK